jgi:hypothetical protein
MPVAKEDPQGMGSAITYARRYALGCMTGLVTEEDDDGNNASQPMKPKYTICDAEVRNGPEEAARQHTVKAHRQNDGHTVVTAATLPPANSVDGSAPIIWNAGKPPHRGKDIREVDGSYLKWYEANGPQDEYRIKASQELDRRDLEQDMNRELPNG